MRPPASIAIACSASRSAIRCAERFAWRVWPEVDGSALKEIAGVFLGRHDFSAFGSAPRQRGSTVRTVLQSQWGRRDDGWNYEVRADAFLYRMVRRLVFVQVAVAQGRCLKETLVAALEDTSLRNQIPAGLAPAHGLTLVGIDYRRRTENESVQIILSESQRN